MSPVTSSSSSLYDRTGRRRQTLCWIVVLAFATNVSAANWPAWRGRRGDGIASEQSLPVRWSSTQNISWRVPLPAAGNSTPIVWDSRVFVTCPINNGKIRTLLCFDRETGAELWRYRVPYSEEETSHPDNPFCSASPTTDGERVYASFGSAGIIACNFNGELVWHRAPGTLAHEFGLATTCVLYQDLLIVYRGPGEPTHIIAVDKRTGRTVWDHPERAKNHGMFGSYSVPLIVSVGDRDEMVLTLPDELKAFDPLNGNLLWRCAGLGPAIHAMPSAGDGIVFGLGGVPGGILAVRTGGRGDVTGTHRLWEDRGNQRRIGSGVCRSGFLYVADASGIARCLDARTGEVVSRRRLGGRLWGSIVLGADRLYFSNTDGNVFVLSADTDLRQIAHNRIDEEMKSSLAASDGQFFIRTWKHLYCIGNRQ
ncbi:MAG: PQQ-binding-like beta-propeller repeat protein [Fuerstiella sp.]|nr:PQQ-binding-like beta-propeller repeat protein [Fuerstiella sp.]